MIPTVKDICSKKTVTIDIEASFEKAVKKMTDANIRTIVIVETSPDKNFYYMSSDDAIEFKIQNIPLQTKLKQLSLKKIQTVDAKVNVLELLHNQEFLSEYLLVLSNHEMIGILSQTDIINNTDPKMLIERQTIGNLILQYTPITIYENEPTVDAIKLMKYKNIDSVIVVNKEKKPKGIFTTKDFLHILQSDKDLNVPVNAYMSSPLQTVNENATIAEVLDFIKVKNFKRVVVANDLGRIVGLITQSEILRVMNNKWMEIIKERGEELSKMNEKLIKKASRLEENASKDYLTNLFNRRKFHTIIDYEISQIKRHNERHLSLILLDIDNFKSINDSYGHDVGDKILIDLAKILQLSCRESDIVARWGGEEFAIALPETSIERGLIVAQKIKTSLEYFTFAEDLTVTCSFGMSQFHTTDNFTSLFKRADEALYKSKNTGKNKIEIKHI